MNFATRYNPPSKEGVTFRGKSLTRQEFLKESLTSTIIERFTRTGVLTPTVNTARIAQFGDFSEVPSDLLEAHERMRSATSIFESLPAETRAYFGNSPMQFVSFMADSANRDKAIELGLIAKAAEAAKPEPPSQPAKQAEAEAAVATK